MTKYRERMPRTRSVSKEDKRNDSSKKQSTKSAKHDNESRSAATAQKLASLKVKSTKIMKRKLQENEDLEQTQALQAPVACEKIKKSRIKKSAKEASGGPSTSLNSTNSKASNDRFVPYGYERSTRVEFNEDGQVLTMSVDENQTAELPSEQDAEVPADTDEIDMVDYDEDDYDHEVSFKDTTADTDPQSNESSDEEEQVTSDKDEDSQQSNHMQVDRRRKMLELDQEIKVKFRELKSMMQETGLESVAAEAEEVFRLADKDKGTNKNVNSNKIKARKTKPSLNNSRLNCRMLTTKSCCHEHIIEGSIWYSDSRHCRHKYSAITFKTNIPCKYSIKITYIKSNIK